MYKITIQFEVNKIGILTRISQALADNGIGLFTISTFNTDYILVKSENLDKAVALAQNALQTNIEYSI